MFLFLWVLVLGFHKQFSAVQRKVSSLVMDSPVTLRCQNIKFKICACNHSVGSQQTKHVDEAAITLLQLFDLLLKIDTTRISLQQVGHHFYINQGQHKHPLFTLTVGIGHNIRRNVEQREEPVKNNLPADQQHSPVKSSSVQFTCVNGCSQNTNRLVQS